MAKILIVDDESCIRELLQDCLECFVAKGVELLAADNGIDALEIIRREKPDLVFLDIMLPRLNGYEVCALVKDDPGLNQVHVVMLSAKGLEFDRQKGHAMGADLYMSKPFMPSELIDVAAKVLGINPD